jgi:hypothetical protein
MGASTGRPRWRRIFSTTTWLSQIRSSKSETRNKSETPNPNGPSGSGRSFAFSRFEFVSDFETAATERDALVQEATELTSIFGAILRKAESK